MFLRTWREENEYMTAVFVSYKEWFAGLEHETNVIYDAKNMFTQFKWKDYIIILLCWIFTSISFPSLPEME